MLSIDDILNTRFFVSVVAKYQKNNEKKTIEIKVIIKFLRLILFK